MIKKILIAAIYIVLFFGKLYAQSPQYSQYTFNKFLLNPAVAGTSGFTTICLTAREQWIGFKGTPKTHSLTFDSKLFPDSYISKNVPIRKKKRRSTRSGKIGLGGHIYNDHNGPLDKTGIEGAYAYHINLDKTILSLGLSLNFFQFRLNTGKIVLSDDLHDDLVDAGKRKVYVTDANFGVYAISESYYGGISTINLFRSVLQFGDDHQGDFKLRRQMNLMGGYKYELTENLIAEPSFLIKIPQGVRAQLDLQIKMNIKRDYWAGLAFRTGSALCIFGGANVDRYYIGYAFDYNFNSLMKYTYGSHEIMAAVKFGDTARRYKWLNTY